ISEQYGSVYTVFIIPSRRFWHVRGTCPLSSLVLCGINGDSILNSVLLSNTFIFDRGTVVQMTFVHFFIW
ncbi:hypothetical protein L9F63_021299, partial [Diploptera punctata]